MLKIAGIVIEGEKRGRVLGYPTANLEFKKRLHISPGIYAGWVIVGKKKYMAGLYIPEPVNRIEAHLLDYTGESLYGTYLEVEAVQKVSEIEKHDSDEELVKKIRSDIEMVREMLRK